NPSMIKRGYDATSIGKELGVQKVITGALFTKQDKFRITLQLIDTRGYYELPLEPVEFNLDDILKAAKLISTRIEKALNLPIISRWEKAFAKKSKHALRP